MAHSSRTGPDEERRQKAGKDPFAKPPPNFGSLCRFLDAGITIGAACSDGRRPKSARARSRGEFGRPFERPALWGFDFHAG
jgi:hypothetical protein